MNEIYLLCSKRFRIDFYLYKKDPLALPAIKYRYLNKSYPDINEVTLSKLLLFPYILLKTYNLINKKKYNFILACDHYSFFILSLVKFLIPKLKIIYLINVNLKRAISEKPNWLYERLLYISTKNLINSASKIIFTSKSLSSDIKKYFGLKTNFTIVYPSFVKADSSKVSSSRSMQYDSFRNDKHFKIISVGRLDYPKDFETIIRAINNLKRLHRRIRLYIVGDGPYKEKLMNLVTELKLKNIIIFAGWTNNPYPFYRNSNLFIFSSFYEGFGRVIIEAMSCGLPIISTDCPYGPAEILEKGKFGILIPPGNYKKMSFYIDKLYRNKKLIDKMSFLSKKRASDYNLHNTVNQTKFSNLFL